MGRTDISIPECVPSEDVFDPLTDDFVSKERNYIHFDHPLSKAQRKRFSISPEQLRTHSFWPLLGFVQESRRAKFNKSGELYFELKPRKIRFGSHRDAAILEYYGKILGKKYEEFLKSQSFGNSVLAYRPGRGTNITQANDLFQEIKSRKNSTAIALDVSKFFDKINHKILFESLKEVLGVERIPDADFQVLKFCTNFSFVEISDLERSLGRSGAVNGRLCTAKEFREKVRGNPDKVVQINKLDFGIPQGTPVSGLLANIAMIKFDRMMYKYLTKEGGSYRRYSDDIAIVLPEEQDAKRIIANVKRQLTKLGLSVNEKKTELSIFSYKLGVLASDRPFQYLGFTFDGTRTLIRSSSIGRYYGKMRRGVRAKVRAAYAKGVPFDQIFLRQLFRRYTHFGRSRNFPRYAYRAAEKMNSPEIKSQLAPHMKQFKRCLRQEIERIYKVSL